MTIFGIEQMVSRGLLSIDIEKIAMNPEEGYGFSLVPEGCVLLGEHAKVHIGSIGYIVDMVGGVVEIVTAVAVLASDTVLAGDTVGTVLTPRAVHEAVRCETVDAFVREVDLVTVEAIHTVFRMGSPRAVEYILRKGRRVRQVAVLRIHHNIGVLAVFTARLCDPHARHLREKLRKLLKKWA